ncbi:MAG: HD-GYP domain-containing protein [Candidatus Aminicenantes bacterium]|nr:HD-GYP domain-containing protein [Candidatus Aminicenantes bacterium]
METNTLNVFGPERFLENECFGQEDFLLDFPSVSHSNLLYINAFLDGNEGTFGHSLLVANYTLAFLRALGIKDREFFLLMLRGSLLHDIGKLAIPKSILRKPGPLSESEREIVKKHPIIGYRMIEKFAFLKKAAAVVLFHHENYDGTGYPFGLTAQEIPFPARVFSLVDTLDALTSDRSYRKGTDFEGAFDEIKRGSGTQFDPLLSEVFLSISLERWKRIKVRTQEKYRFVRECGL